MLQVNVSVRDVGVVFNTFSERAPDEAGMDTPDTVSRTAGAQTSSTRAQTRPRWTSGDQIHMGPDEAQQKEPSECKKYSTPSSDEGAKSFRCRKKNRRRPKDRSGGNELLWFGLALGALLVFAFFWSLFLGCWCPWSAFFLARTVPVPVFSLFFLCMGAESLSGIPIIRWYAAIRVTYLRCSLRTDGTR